MSRQCQSWRYRPDADGRMQPVRCKHAATATFPAIDKRIDLCTIHLGMTLIYGGIWFMDDAGQTWELDTPKRYALQEDQP